MITQTSEIAVKAMIFLARRESDALITPKRIAEVMGCSPSYLAKVMGNLSKANLVESRRGPHGGVRLAYPAESITLLQIVEACEGLLVGNYCKAIGEELGPVCAFHEAMLDILLAAKKSMTGWTLQALADRPEPSGPLVGNEQCRMSFLQCLAKKGDAIGC